MGGILKIQDASRARLSVGPRFESGVMLERVTASTQSGTGRHSILYTGVSMERGRLLVLDTVLRS